MSYCHGCGEYTDEQPPSEGGRAAASDPRPEADIRRDIVTYLRLVGYEVWDTEQGYRADGTTRVTKGLPDLVIAGHGYTLMAEVKSVRGKLTPEQQQFRVAWSRNGGGHAVWRSAFDAKLWHETREATT